MNMQCIFMHLCGFWGGELVNTSFTVFFLTESAVDAGRLRILTIEPWYVVKEGRRERPLTPPKDGRGALPLIGREQGGATPSWGEGTALFAL